MTMERRSDEPEAVVEVALEAPAFVDLDPLLSYRSDRSLLPGTLIRVPLGSREVAAMVWDAAAGSTPRTDLDALRPVTETLDAVPPLGAAWRSLVAFAAAYYQRSIGEVALAVLPGELRKVGAEALRRRVARWDKKRPAGPTQASGAASVGTPPATPDRAPTELSSEQADAVHRSVAAMASPAPGTLLLHGVTGSGKTEVYLRATAAALEAGRQSLVLVPEINLTPQLIGRFVTRFPERTVVALHSGLTPVERLRHWLLAHRGDADIVLGTRLAVFASLPRLGLVVVDEEHDPSYKQQEGARYSARDLAVWRGRHENALVILGSATPSLETWHAAETGRYAMAALAERHGGAERPAVRLIDMNVVMRPRPGLGQPPPPALAPALLEAMQVRIGHGEQCLVFLNRRGYAPVLQCPDCGWQSACPHCSAWRVFHRQDRTLRCHHCGLADPVPRRCPECGNPHIEPVGRGTERLEEQIAGLLPGARVARIDADTARRKGALVASLAAVHDGEVDVLVGTQMIAKGHDFRRIGLVAAVNPDTSLFSSDFRAPERLFALLMQAAGRAGRDAAMPTRAEMLVQTWHPTHPLYAALVRDDYAGFATTQLAEREAAGLPPFSHLAVLRADAKTVDAARAFLLAASADAQALDEAAAVTIYAPVPLAVARVADVERLQMLVESTSRPALQAMLRAWLPRLRALHAAKKPAAERVVRWAVDVDPLAI